jgi:hypothetical protein
MFFYVNLSGKCIRWSQHRSNGKELGKCAHALITFTKEMICFRKYTTPCCQRDHLSSFRISGTQHKCQLQWNTRGWKLVRLQWHIYATESLTENIFPIVRVPSAISAILNICGNYSLYKFLSKITDQLVNLHINESACNGWMDAFIFVRENHGCMHSAGWHLMQ